MQIIVINYKDSIPTGDGVEHISSHQLTPAPVMQYSYSP